MLDEMLTLDYRYRPNAKDLLKHPFLKNKVENVGNKDEEEKVEEVEKANEEL
jgi:hypothetical protein